MIPKKIHYCWFGRKPLPELALKCIDSWRKYLPDFEIIEWNEDNFDVNMIPYTAEAYSAKKYAFVSDYARFWILYKYGGIYFDTDVEVIKSMDNVISKGAFMARECDRLGAVAPGLGIGAPALLPVYKEILDKYSKLHFIYSDGTFNLKTVVQYTTEILLTYGLEQADTLQKCAEMWIYPQDYFCPKDYFGNLNITANSISIHHFDGSWLSEEKRYINQKTVQKGKSVFYSSFIVFYAAFKYRGCTAALKELMNFILKKRNNR